MFLIVLVINDPYFCNDLLEAWRVAGVPGATILESRGLGRVLKGARDDIPLMPSLDDLVSKEELRHRTVFSVVWDKETIERVKDVTQQVIGRFEDDNTGFFFVVDVLEVHGMRKSDFGK
jgi:nitrogen regulatory protein PII